MDLRDPQEFSRHSRPVVSFATLTVICIVLALGGCSRGSGARSSEQSNETPAAKRNAEAPRKPDLPDCPAGDLDRVEPGSRDTGDHKVVVSWNGSVPSTSNGERVGYCLYRSQGKPVEANQGKKKSNSKKKTPCKRCEQVNITPVMDTACVDEIVQNDTTYYYAAVAIDKAGQFSSLSKQAFARIPGSKEPPKSSSPSVYRSCREWDIRKQAPGAGSQGNP